MSYTKKELDYHLWGTGFLLGGAIGVFIHFTNWQAGLALFAVIVINNYERYLTAKKEKIMHNPKPEPSTKRPTAPPGPQNPLHTEKLKYVTRLDTDKPGVFIVKLATSIPLESRNSLSKELHKKISVFAPGSELVILPSYVEAVEIQNKTEPEPSDAWMNERIGKKETIEFPKWQFMETAPGNRYILTIDNHEECEVVMWSPSEEGWRTSNDGRVFPVRWMELPK